MKLSEPSSRRVPASLLALLLGLYVHSSPLAQTQVDPRPPADSVSQETARDPNAIDCTKHGGKVHTLRCATRSLDGLPGGRWLKWALAITILVGVPYVTIQRLLSLWRGRQSARRKRDTD